MRRFPVILVLSLFVGTLAAPVASAKPRSRRAPAATFAPVEVIFRDPVGNKKDAASRIARKVRLEAGAMTASTCGLSEGEASRSRAKYLLRATESVEGGYDAVNIYDRGILSWGIMQWASHSNSLQDALYYMKGRLRDKNKSRVWKTLFKDRGLDVQRGPDGSAAFLSARTPPAPGGP